MNLAKYIEKLSLVHDKRKYWRNKNRKKYEAWANQKKKCMYCGKNVVNKRKSAHKKGKKCLKTRGIIIPRKVRSDKGKRHATSMRSKKKK